jgi:hypothetical protein
MIRSVAAELLVTRKRASTWILMGTWVLLGILFAYLSPYLDYSGASQGRPTTPLTLLLPERLADNLLGGFPFFGGVIALMLGVLAVGSILPIDAPTRRRRSVVATAAPAEAVPSTTAPIATAPPRSPPAPAPATHPR